MLQELTPVGPGLIGHVRKPFIRIVVKEHHPLQELPSADLGASGRLRKPFIRLVIAAHQLLE